MERRKAIASILEEEPAIPELPATTYSLCVAEFQLEA